VRFPTTVSARAIFDPIHGCGHQSFFGVAQLTCNLGSQCESTRRREWSAGAPPRIAGTKRDKWWAFATTKGVDRGQKAWSDHESFG